MNELLNCPFCGGDPFLGYRSAQCKDCGARTYLFDSQEEIITAWNKRVEQSIENDLRKE